MEHYATKFKASLLSQLGNSQQIDVDAIVSLLSEASNLPVSDELSKDANYNIVVNNIKDRVANVIWLLKNSKPETAKSICDKLFEIAKSTEEGNIPEEQVEIINILKISNLLDEICLEFFDELEPYLLQGDSTSETEESDFTEFEDGTLHTEAIMDVVQYLDGESERSLRSTLEKIFILKSKLYSAQLHFVEKQNLEYQLTDFEIQIENSIRTKKALDTNDINASIEQIEERISKHNKPKTFQYKAPTVKEPEVAAYLEPEKVAESIAPSMPEETVDFSSFETPQSMSIPQEMPTIIDWEYDIKLKLMGEYNYATTQSLQDKDNNKKLSYWSIQAQRFRLQMEIFDQLNILHKLSDSQKEQYRGYIIQNYTKYITLERQAIPEMEQDLEKHAKRRQIYADLKEVEFKLKQLNFSQGLSYEEHMQKAEFSMVKDILELSYREFDEPELSEQITKLKGELELFRTKQGTQIAALASLETSGEASSQPQPQPVAQQVAPSALPQAQQYAQPDYSQAAQQGYPYQQQGYYNPADYQSQYANYYGQNYAAGYANQNQWAQDNLYKNYLGQNQAYNQAYSQAYGQNYNQAAYNTQGAANWNYAQDYNSQQGQYQNYQNYQAPYGTQGAATDPNYYAQYQGQNSSYYPYDYGQQYNQQYNDQNAQGAYDPYQSQAGYPAASTMTSGTPSTDEEKQKRRAKRLASSSSSESASSAQSTMAESGGFVRQVRPVSPLAFAYGRPKSNKQSSQSAQSAQNS